MATAERRMKLAERVQKDGTPHKFKRWVYLYHRHKSRIIAGLLVVIAMLTAGLVYVGWKLYEKEPGVVMRAGQFTVFQNMEEEEVKPEGFLLGTDDSGEATLSPIYKK